MAPHPEPLFIDVAAGPLGQRFALHHAPRDGSPLGLVVYVHPFAEEMNKSRRMAALQSRALAAAGFAVLQMDLLGCGDSGGDFGDATWQAWIDDVGFACRWLRQRHTPQAGAGEPPLWLWGLRVGCLLATDAATRLDAGCNLLLWQPTVTGNGALQQFLRLKLAGEMLGGQAKGAMAALRQRLAGGEAAEIAGYLLHPALAAGLEQATLRPPVQGQVHWLEVATSRPPTLTPASVRAIEHWRQAGCAVHAQAVTGPAFWQTAEIEEAPELLTQTLAAMLGNEGSGDTPATAQAAGAATPSRVSA